MGDRKTRYIDASFRIFLIAWLALAGLLASGLGGQRPSAVQAQEGVQIRLSPTPTTVMVGDTFNLDVTVVAGVQPIDGAQIYLNFDPAVLQVVNIVPDLTVLNTVISAGAFDNVAGTLSYAAGILSGTAATGTFRILTVAFQAVAPSAGSNVTFDIVADPQPVTRLTNAGMVIPFTVANALVIVIGPTATPTATGQATIPSPTVTNTPTATATFSPTPTATTITATPTLTGTLQYFEGYVRYGTRQCPGGAVSYYYLSDCLGQPTYVLLNSSLASYVNIYVRIVGDLGTGPICAAQPEQGVIPLRAEVIANPCEAPTCCPTTTCSPTPTNTATSAGTATFTATPTATATATATPTGPVSETATATCPPPGTPTATATCPSCGGTPTRTATVTATATVTPTSLTAATLHGRVILPCRSDYSGVIVSANGYSTSTDITGYYNLIVPPGNYTMMISKNGYLRANCMNVTVAGGTTRNLPEVTLLAGDVDVDCDIDLFDLVALAAAYGQTPPAPPPPYIDLNGDGTINILDVVVLASHYNMSCPGSWSCP